MNRSLHVVPASFLFPLESDVPDSSESDGPPFATSAACDGHVEGGYSCCLPDPNPKSMSISLSSPRESKALLIGDGRLRLSTVAARPWPTFSGDCPIFARFCFFHSSNERNFALSRGESLSDSVSVDAGSEEVEGIGSEEEEGIGSEEEEGIGSDSVTSCIETTDVAEIASSSAPVSGPGASVFLTSMVAFDPIVVTESVLASLNSPAALAVPFIDLVQLIFRHC